MLRFCSALLLTTLTGIVLVRGGVSETGIERPDVSINLQTFHHGFNINGQVPNCSALQGGIAACGAAVKAGVLSGENEGVDVKVLDKETFDAMNIFKDYLRSMQSAINGSSAIIRLGEKLDSEEKSRILDILQDAETWLGSNLDLHAQDIKEKQQKLEAVCAPIVSKYYWVGAGASSEEEADGEDVPYDEGLVLIEGTPQTNGVKIKAPGDDGCDCLDVMAMEKEILDAMSIFKDYLRSMESAVTGSSAIIRLGEKLDSEEKSRIMDILQNAETWLDSNLDNFDNLDVQTVKAKQREVEAVCAPVVSKYCNEEDGVLDEL